MFFLQSNWKLYQFTRLHLLSLLIIINTDYSSLIGQKIEELLSFLQRIEVKQEKKFRGLYAGHD